MEKNGHELDKRTIHSSPTLQEYEIESEPPVQKKKKSSRAGKVILVIVLLLAVVAAYNLFKNPMYPVYPGPSGQTETSSADIGQTGTSSATTSAETDESEEIVSDSASFSNDPEESAADTEAQTGSEDTETRPASEDTEASAGSDESEDSSSAKKTKEDEYTAAEIEEAAAHIWDYRMTDEDGNMCYVGFYENEDSSIAGMQFLKTDGSAITFDYHDGEVILEDGKINVTNPGLDELEAGGEYQAYTYTWIRDKESFTKADLGEDEIIVEVDGTQYLLTSGKLETYVTIHQKLVNINWA